MKDWGTMIFFLWFFHLFVLFVSVDVDSNIFPILFIFTIIISILAGILNSELNNKGERE